ncbi:MAG: ABC transporter substrate-binding protein, partial [Chloroflexota bacterium]|nr:ABC transporter substrate-binding protein [Chloroflexota bacterium]
MRTWRDPTTWDPGRTASAGEVITTALAYNNLLWYSSAGYTIECELCETWAITDNGLTHTFKLRKGVKFQTSGKELTSADIKWNLEKWAGRIDGIKSPRTGPIDDYMDVIQTPDDYTVVVKMKRPAPAFATFIANDYVGIVEKDTTQAQLKAGPYGTGPYKLKTLIPGADIIFVPNPNYWKPGLPYLNEMHKVVIATSSEPAVRAAFVANQIDYSDVRVSPDLKPKYEEMAKKGDIKIWEQPHHWMEGLLINTNRAPFTDVRVRQAVNLAIDRDGYNQVVNFGTGVPIYFSYSIGEPWNPFKTEEEFRKLPGWAKTGPAKDAERAQAKKLLADAGFPNGFKMELITESASTPNEYFAGEMKKIGIDAQAVSKGNLFDQFFSTGNYDASAQ